MADWYLKQANDVSGPYSWEELRFLSDRLKVAAGQSVRQGVAGDWLPAEQVSGLLMPSSKDALPPSQRQTIAAPTRAATKPNPQVAPPTENTGRAEVVASPPQLRKTARGDDRRWIVAISVLLAVLFVGLLLMLLTGLIESGGPALAGNGTGAGGDSPAAGESQGSAASAGAAPAEAAADSASESTRAIPSSTASQAGDDAPPDNAPPADETAQQAPMPSPTAEGDGEGAGSGGAPAPSPPLPRSAAVIMPLDDDEVLAGDGSNASPGAAGGTAQFFQIQGKGRRFAYVVDCSGSMAGDPFDKACAELRRSIEALKSGQSFFVVFFDSGEYPQFHPRAGEGLLRASPANKRRLREWVSGFVMPGGGTDPRVALLQALALRPDAIYLLSDGEFDPDIALQVRQQNRRRTAIHTISFMNRAAEPLLRRIASENKGSYRFVP
jgi:hypothetical protein